MPRVLSQSSWNQSRPPSICRKEVKRINSLFFFFGVFTFFLLHSNRHKLSASRGGKVLWKCSQLLIYLEHGAGVNTREHNDSSSLKSPDSQAEPHLSTLTSLCHSVLDVAVSRKTQRGLAYSVTTHKHTQFKRFQLQMNAYPLIHLEQVGMTDPNKKDFQIIPAHSSSRSGRHWQTDGAVGPARTHCMSAGQDWPSQSSTGMGHIPHVLRRGRCIIRRTSSGILDIH